MATLAIAFYFLSEGKIEARSIQYQLIQLFGCLFIALDSFFKGAFPSVLLQAFCMFVSIKTINSIISKKVESIEKMIEDEK
jgi:hypothetical protein